LIRLEAQESVFRAKDKWPFDEHTITRELSYRILTTHGWNPLRVTTFAVTLTGRIEERLYSPLALNHFDKLLL